MYKRLKQNQFLLEELVKRDFKKKYKGTMLGMLWSILNPLLQLVVMALVFTQLFGRNTPHYTIYLFCGNLIYAFFNESTNAGMTSITGNANIFTKINVPKYLFILAKNIQTVINFGIILVVLFIFVAFDGIPFTWLFFLLFYPILFLLLFNTGTGMILSVLHVFFRDLKYIYSVFLMLVMYSSAIFYTIDSFPPNYQNIFLLNPIYVFITYFRQIILEATIPSLFIHGLILFYTSLVLIIGGLMYKKYNHKFLYYL